MNKSKRTVLLVVAAVGFAFTASSANTNIIEFGNKSVRFSDLTGKQYDAVLIRATPLGLVLSTNAGSAQQISFANLSASTAESLGIPKPWFENGLSNAIAKRSAYDRWKTSYNAQGASLAFQRQYANALESVAAKCNQSARAAEAKAQEARDRVSAMHGRIAAERAAQDQAWNRYVYTDSSYQKLHGNRVENEATRREAAQAISRQLSVDLDQLVTLENDAERAQKNCESELQKLERDCAAQIKQVNEYYQRLGNTSGNTNVADLKPR